jgi:hypothetical protein
MSKLRMRRLMSKYFLNLINNHGPLLVRFT